MFTKEQVQQFGIVSNGTLNANHVIPRLLTFLEEQAKEKFDEFMSSHPELVKAYADFDIKHIYGSIVLKEWDQKNPYWDSEDCLYDFSDLIDAIDSLTPDGYYFGQHDGCPSDFGFFSSEEE